MTDNVTTRPTQSSWMNCARKPIWWTPPWRSLQPSNIRFTLWEAARSAETLSTVASYTSTNDFFRRVDLSGTCNCGIFFLKKYCKPLLLIIENGFKSSANHTMKSWFNCACEVAGPNFGILCAIMLWSVFCLRLSLGSSCWFWSQTNNNQLTLPPFLHFKSSALCNAYVLIHEPNCFSISNNVN